jgi:hypothetical protein
MNSLKDIYRDPLPLSLKSALNTTAGNSTPKTNTFTTPSLKSGLSSTGPTSPANQPSSTASPGQYRTFSELTQPPKVGTVSRGVYDYAESYKGMPALPALGKAMSDYGSALKQGAKEFFTPNETYRNFLYGEEPTAFQQAANSLAPTTLKPNTQSLNSTAAKTTTPQPSLKGYITTNGMTQPYYGGDTEQNANIPLGGLKLATSQQHEAEQPQGAMVLPWNSHTFYNPSQSSLSQQDINDFYTRTDLEQYRARELARAQRDNAILSESGRTQYDPKTGRVTESAHDTGGFTPTLATIARGDDSDAQYKQGLLALQRNQLAENKRQFDITQQAPKKFEPAYSNDELSYLPEEVSPIEYQRASVIPKQKRQYFEQLLADANTDDERISLIRQFALHVGISPDTVMDLAYPTRY